MATAISSSAPRARFGLGMLAILFAAGLGYAVAAIGWRLWTRAKARKRATGEI